VTGHLAHQWQQQQQQQQQQWSMCSPLEAEHGSGGLNLLMADPEDNVTVGLQGLVCHLELALTAAANSPMLPAMAVPCLLCCSGLSQRASSSPSAPPSSWWRPSARPSSGTAAAAAAAAAGAGGAAAGQGHPPRHPHLPGSAHRGQRRAHQAGAGGRGEAGRVCPAWLLLLQGCWRPPAGPGSTGAGQAASRHHQNHHQEHHQEHHQKYHYSCGGRACCWGVTGQRLLSWCCTEGPRARPAAQHAAPEQVLSGHACRVTGPSVWCVPLAAAAAAARRCLLRCPACPLAAAWR